MEREAVRSWWEERGGKGDGTKGLSSILPSPLTNLELTRAGREVAESSQAPPQPPRGNPQLWEGLPLMQQLPPPPLPLLPPLLPPLPPLDRPHRYLHEEKHQEITALSEWQEPCPLPQTLSQISSPGTQPLLTSCLVPRGFGLHPYPVLLKGPPCPRSLPNLNDRWTSLAFLRSPIGPFEPPCPTHTIPPPPAMPHALPGGCGVPLSRWAVAGGHLPGQGGRPPPDGSACGRPAGQGSCSARCTACTGCGQPAGPGAHGPSPRGCAGMLPW